MTLLRQATKTANRRRRGILLGLGAVDSSYQGLEQRKSDRVISGRGVWRGRTVAFTGATSLIVVGASSVMFGVSLSVSLKNINVPWFKQFCI